LIKLVELISLLIFNCVTPKSYKEHRHSNSFIFGKLIGLDFANALLEAALPHKNSKLNTVIVTVLSVR
jgi:hypothetical protein